MRIDNLVLRRSNLIMPANKPKFIEQAWKRGADTITLDMEDSVPAAEKAYVRTTLEDSVKQCLKGGAEVFIKINNDPLNLTEDIKASVLPGVSGIMIPKVEDADTLQKIDKLVTQYEKERGIPEGTIDFQVAIETLKGYMNADEIADASKRNASLSLGTEDFLTDAGIFLETGDELIVPKQHIILVARAHGLEARGLVGSFANYKDLEGLAKVARRSYCMGSRGSSCIHPDQVAVLNKAFAPSESEVKKAEKIVAKYEQATNDGTGAIGVDDSMIDVPVMKKAQNILSLHSLILKLEAQTLSKEDER